MLVESNKMTHAAMPDIGIGLECARVTVGSIIAPFLYGWRNERIDRKEGNQYYQAGTDIEQWVFSWAGQLLSPSLSPARVGRKIVSPSA